MSLEVGDNSSCIDSNSKLKSDKLSHFDSQEYIRLKDATDNEDIIIRKKRSETMHYDIGRKNKSPHNISIGNHSI